MITASNNGEPPLGASRLIASVSVVRSVVSGTTRWATPLALTMAKCSPGFMPATKSSAAALIWGKRVALVDELSTTSTLSVSYVGPAGFTP
ncbi:unannotated protein [freshwater metagenome]|uniref:Unannotated protein n=1 Tax=freshwater metagenome TaxID=449393 RepID=A0A6J7QY82_9ZZZZ